MLKLISIIVLVCVSYFPSIYGGFIWDDNTFLTNNPIMEKPDTLKRFWMSTEAPDYFPLVSTSLWLQRLLWGLNPMGFHIFNIVLHAFNTVMLWHILCKLRFRYAWVAAAIFGVHPVHVESVAWITEIKNLQSTFFFMLTLICYLNFLYSQKKRWYILSLLIFLLALLSKTSVVMLPLILLLYHWWSEESLSKTSLLNAVPFFLLSALFSAVTVWFQYNRAGAMGESWSVEYLERVAIAGRAVWFYMGKLILPLDLTFIYPRWSMDPGKASSYVPVTALLSVFIILWNRRRSWGRPLLAGSVYFVINLLPILGFFNIYFMRYSFVTDHWQYLASPGIIVLAVWIVTLLIDDASLTRSFAMNNTKGSFFQMKKYLKVSLGCLLLGILMFSTFQRAKIFQKNFSIWEDTLKKNPNSWMAHNNIGLHLEEKGKLNEAIEHYKAAIRINPRYAVTYDNLGLILKRKGNPEEAAIHFKEAIRQDPKLWTSYNNLGYVLNALGKHDEAASYFQRALAINPRSIVAHNNLANILDAKGDIEKAKVHYMKALSIDSESAEIHNNLGTLFQAEKKYLKAVKHFQKAIELQPDLKEARKNLTIAMELLKKAAAK